MIEQRPPHPVLGGIITLPMLVDRVVGTDLGVLGAKGVEALHRGIENRRAPAVKRGLTRCIYCSARSLLAPLLRPQPTNGNPIAMCKRYVAGTSEQSRAFPYRVPGHAHDTDAHLARRQIRSRDWPSIPHRHPGARPPADDAA